MWKASYLCLLMLCCQQSQSQLDRRRYNDRLSHRNSDVNDVLILVRDSPVSVEEPRPGSLCDLTRRRSPALSLLTPSPSFSTFPALRRRYNGSWPKKGGPLPCPPLCSLAAGEDKVGGAEEAGVAPWREGVEGQIRNSGMEDRCWEVETSIASSWEQLLASMAWRRRTGDLECKNRRELKNISCKLWGPPLINCMHVCSSSPVCSGRCARWRAGVGPLSSDEAPGSWSSRQRTLWCLTRGTTKAKVLPTLYAVSSLTSGPVAPLPLVPQTDLHQTGVLRGRGVIGDVHDLWHQQRSTVHGY